MFLNLSMIFILFASTLLSSAQASPPKKLLMAAMGDSITAATLADLPLPSHADPITQVQNWAQSELSSQFIYTNKTLLSWASGKRVDSHFVRLKEWLLKNGEKRELEMLNVSHPGDMSEKMQKQAYQVLRAMVSGKYDALKYLVLLIGANDACDDSTPIGIPPEIFEANVMKAFEMLSFIRQKEPIRILVLGLPKIPDLGAPEYRHASTYFGLSCEFVRNKILHFCDPLMRWNTPEEHEKKLKIVENLNLVLKDAVQRANAKFPNLEIVYSDRLNQSDIPLSLLAADCFHPNKSGQEVVARETWYEQPWFREDLRNNAPNAHRVKP